MVYHQAKLAYIPFLLLSISATVIASQDMISGAFKEGLAPGLRVFEIQYGYMEIITVERLLRKSGIDEKAIFYGAEDIVTRNAVWKVFAVIKRLSPTV